MKACARFVSGSLAHGGWRADGRDIRLGEPRAVHIATRIEDVVAALAEADRAAARGEWAAVMVAYEAAAAFDAAMPHDPRPRPPDAVPLAWVAVFADQPGITDAELRRGLGAAQRPAPASDAPWRPALSREAFGAAIDRVLALIAAGDTYQVNYTFPLSREGRGPLDTADLDAWLDTLCTAHEAGYGARLDLGRYVVLSASPELFVERRGDILRARPMKGTSPRGRWLSEDATRRDALVASEKARAENVMVVDLLRNDLGRIAETGSVEVPALFTAEAYPTVWQLTSTIEGRLPQPAAGEAAPGIIDSFRALFPCGSVTGAPKISTMAIIAGLEPAPRGVYTGAIGYVAPGGDAVFSVAIRTLVVDCETGAATLGVGAGIVADSRADDEYDECLLKAAFADAAPNDPGVVRATTATRTTPGASVVRVPPAAQRDFELLETARVEAGAWQHLERHLDCLGASARYFGFRWNRQAVEAAVAGAEALPGIAAAGFACCRQARSPWKRCRCRCCPSRAGSRLRRCRSTRRTCSSATRPRAATSTPRRSSPAGRRRRRALEHARRDHRIDDRQRDRRARRRPLDATAHDGLLAGVGRGLLLDAGTVRERAITLADLKSASRVWLVSALRGEVQATVVG